MVTMVYKKFWKLHNTNSTSSQLRKIGRLFLDIRKIWVHLHFRNTVTLFLSSFRETFSFPFYLTRFMDVSQLKAMVLNMVIPDLIYWQQHLLDFFLDSLHKIKYVRSYFTIIYFCVHLVCIIIVTMVLNVNPMTPPVKSKSPIKSSVQCEVQFPCLLYVI